MRTSGETAERKSSGICELCGSSKRDSRYRFDELEVVQCRDCGLVFIGEYAGDVDGQDLYDADYFTEREEYFLHGTEPHPPELSGEHIESFREGLRVIGQYKEGGRLLDLGCAVGVFLSMAKQEGWDVVGVDISEYAAARARERCQTEVYAGELVDVHFDEASFDVITMWDVVEHFAHPQRVLQEVHRILKDDGLILLDTPNEGSLIRRLAHFIYRCFGGRIAYPAKRLYHIYHRYYFSEETLRRLLDASGFRVVQMVRKPIPREKGRGNTAERLVVSAMGLLERQLHMDFELLVVACKR
jgi:2-polyprenyl-3-methyl-5-hydroxy-6-metoxy-1,4-benzoquinol methylase